MSNFLLTALAYIVPFLLVLTVVVTIHEMGHFLTARAFGVKVDRFSIGFGPSIFSRTSRKSGVEYRLAWLPLGGYVKFTGDLDASSVPDAKGLAELKARYTAEHGAGAESSLYHFKPVWQRMLIVAAGPVANFILAFVLFTGVFSVIGEQIVAPRVAQVAAGSPAAQAGFQPRDLITAINGRPVVDSGEVTERVLMSAGDEMRFTVQRGDQTLTLMATPQRELEDNPIAGRVRVARIGLGIAPLTRDDISIRRLNPIEAGGKSIGAIGSTLGTTITYLGRIFSGRESGDLLNGPIGIAKAAGGLTTQAATAYSDPGLNALNVALRLVQFAALVSIGIGFLNLLPIPVLDGGHLVFYAYEAVARRPVSASVQEAGYRVGLALLAGLMLFATWNDLQKLSLFEFLGGLTS